MRIVIAPDSFKESLTSLEVAKAIESGICEVFPDAECIKIPVADGGEGMLQSLIDATQGTKHYLITTERTPACRRMAIA